MKTVIFAFYNTLAWITQKTNPFRKIVNTGQKLREWLMTTILSRLINYGLIWIPGLSSFLLIRRNMRIKVSDGVRKRYLDNARTIMDALVEMEMIAHAKVRADKPKMIRVGKRPPGRFRRRFEVAA